jgi:hypothetical protein
VNPARKGTSFLEHDVTAEMVWVRLTFHRDRIGPGSFPSSPAGPNLINDGRLVFNEERSRAGQGLHIGLFHRLDRRKAHGGPTHRFADRFRISTIIRVGLDMGLDILGTHQLGGMPGLFKR